MLPSETKAKEETDSKALSTDCQSRETSEVILKKTQLIFANALTISKYCGEGEK